NIAERFNGVYGNVFTVPEPYIPKAGARVMSLADPTRKMSKSDPNPKGTVYLTDEPNVIMKKFKSAVTDSEMSVRYADGKDGINNLMTIYSAVTGKDYQAIEDEFAGKGYGDFKTAVVEAVVAELEPVQKKYKELMNDKAYLQECWTNGGNFAQRLSQRTLDKAMKKIGFLMK
ncbi:MAG: tryptophan--tRNA ligase, partial [Eubacterium sp.]|nr:tryptophan--tRNA ligase [Eubacterium sp.]